MIFSADHLHIMECRTFELTLNSASDLPDVRRLGQMKVYAEVSILGQSESAYTTPTDEIREVNPYWNFEINYVVLEKAVQHEGTIIFIKLYSKRSLKGDKYVGQVKLSLKELFESGLEEEDREFDVDCHDCKYGFPKLKLSYKFGKTAMLTVDKKNHVDYQKIGAISGVVGAVVGFAGLAVSAVGVLLGGG